MPVAAEIDTGPSTYRDRCVIGGVLVPGVVDVSVKQSRKVERKTPKGSGGARMTDNGYQGADVSISIVLWTEEQRLAFYGDLMPKISPRTPDGPKTPLGIEHFKTAAHGVTTIYIVDIDDGAEARGKQTIRLKAFEWLPGPKPITKAPGSATPAEEEVGIYDEDDPTHRFPADVAGEGIEFDDGAADELFIEE